MAISETLKRRLERNKQDINDGYRKPIDRAALGGHDGKRYTPGAVPEGAGPPYVPTRLRTKKSK